MTPQEKAKELVDKYLKEVGWLPYASIPAFEKVAKQCALIAVDEILDFFFYRRQYTYNEKDFAWWNGVKEAILLIH